jgi:hypothetical protein
MNRNKGRFLEGDRHTGAHKGAMVPVSHMNPDIVIP